MQIQISYINFRRVTTVDTCSDFWGNVHRRTDAPSQIARIGGSRHPFLTSELTTCRQSEVSYFDIVNAIRTNADENILWLEIPMYDVQAVNMDQTL